MLTYNLRVQDQAINYGEGELLQSKDDRSTISVRKVDGIRKIESSLTIAVPPCHIDATSDSLITRENRLAEPEEAEFSFSKCSL